MQKRVLGRHGIQVSEIGFGAWQLGDENLHGRLSDRDGIDMVHTALDKGCNFFDTAPNYGLGRSEELLGKALEGERKNVVLSTKFGHHSDGNQDYNCNLIRETLTGSLKRLKTDYIDVYLLHNPPLADLNGMSGCMQELEKLQKDGLVRSFGASVDYSPDILEAVRTSNADVLEVMFNILHQEPLGAMNEAAEKGYGLVIKIPLDSGWLSGKYNSETKFTDIRGRWTEAEVKRRAELLNEIRWLTEGGLTMAEAALGFVLGHKIVSTVIPGVKNQKTFLQNLKAADVKLPDGTVEKLHAFWRRELSGKPIGW